MKVCNTKQVCPAESPVHAPPPKKNMRFLEVRHGKTITNRRVGPCSVSPHLQVISGLFGNNASIIVLLLLPCKKVHQVAAKHAKCAKHMRSEPVGTFFSAAQRNSRILSNKDQLKYSQACPCDFLRSVVCVTAPESGLSCPSRQLL